MTSPGHDLQQMLDAVPVEQAVLILLGIRAQTDAKLVATTEALTTVRAECMIAECELEAALTRARVVRERMHKSATECACVVTQLAIVRDLLTAYMSTYRLSARPVVLSANDWAELVPQE